MPSPNAAQKPSTKKTPVKEGEDLGQKLAKKRSQDFKSKIEGWNQAGAGVAQAQDEVVVIMEEGKPAVVAPAAKVAVDKKPAVKKTPKKEEKVEDAPEEVVETPPRTPIGGLKAGEKQTTQRKNSREIDTDKKAWVRRKSKPAVELAAEVKEATTPKKRVVSDGHWRRDKLKKDEPSPEKDKEKETEKEKAKEPTPKPVVIRRSVVSIGIRASPSTKEVVEVIEAPPRSRPARRSRSHERGDGRESAPDYESPGTKVYVKRKRRSRTSDPKDKNWLSTAESSFTASSSLDKASTNTGITTPDVSPTKASTPGPSTAPKERTVSKLVDDIHAQNRSSDTEDLPRKVSRAKGTTFTPKDEDRPARPRIPSNKAPPTPIPRVPGNRIEGWLSNMPEDPFAPPSEASVVSDPPRRRSRRADERDDDYDTGRRRSSGRIKKSRSSLEPVDTDEQGQGPRKWSSIDDWVDQATPTSLKRSGARRNTQSPVKDRAFRGASEPLDDQDSAAGLPRSGSRRYTYNGLQGRQHAAERPRLPTIASANVLEHSNRQLSIIEGSTLSRASDGDEPIRGGTGLKRRLTKHSDLMSVLSMSRDDDHHAPMRRSRSRRVRNETTSIADLMNEITTDELKYQRELRTLVDGVIPVLLTYVISKSDASRPTRSRKSSLHDSPTLTQPIYDMGVSLERLKTSHKRIPMHDANELLIWAQSTAKLYSEYLKAWRLGFEDIVVNLAPADENGQANPADDGERVDVAYLLKRPLVRVKNLGKTLSAITKIKPSALAEDLAITYQDLVSEARRRSNDERARLEDEAAAAIDPTRARDPRNLVQLNGVTIDPTRSVGARDYFDMELFHSSGQQLGCKVELIRRDDPPSIAGPGDVLFCEVASTGRWLLFPPILASYVTARRGDKEGEIVVMIRGLLQSGGEWREVMSLRSTEDQGDEWLQMLGSDPMPPRLTRQSSFNTPRIPSKGYNAPPSLTESEVPIGERARSSAPRWDGSDVNSTVGPLHMPGARGIRARRYYSGAPGNFNEVGEDRNQNDQKRSRYHHVRSKTEWASDHETSRQKKDYNVWLPSSDRDSEESADEEDRPARRPTMHRRTSSVPSQDMPTIPKLRKGEQVDHTPKLRSSTADPSSAPSKLQKRQTRSQDEAPSTPTQPSVPTTSTRPTSLGLRSGALPSFTPAFLKKHRRSSSPLKHEYEPSTATESSSDSDLSDSDDDRSITSHSTVDDAISTIGELKDFSRHVSSRAPATRSTSSAAVDQETLRPSDSPSQAPYRGVPPSTTGSAKSVACILAWNDRGSWDTMHPEECEIVVTPGLIEAFDLAQAHAVAGKIDELSGPSPSSHGIKPLVALELTPLVPLRRGTALDISIRSPPTSNSVLRISSNIMFRSRSPEECERLYNMINRARIDNPTWIALQHARGPMPTSNWGEAMDKRNAARSNGSPSWMKSLSRKGSTYRSKGARSASIAASQSSIGTMNSAMSALRRFSGGSRFFNIAKSTIVSREGTRSSGSDSLESGRATPVAFDINMGTPLGITNTKCRFYTRENQTSWRDMGPARLTIMLPPRPDPSIPADPNTTGVTKRVLITAKSGVTLLDVTLEENCFERTGRTGIMVSVWRELIGPNGEMGRAAATGGVGTSQTRKFMIQLKSERDAAFTFSMVGKLRY